MPPQVPKYGRTLRSRASVNVLRTAVSPHANKGPPANDWTLWLHFLDLWCRCCRSQIMARSIVCRFFLVFFIHFFHIPSLHFALVKLVRYTIILQGNNSKIGKTNGLFLINQIILHMHVLPGARKYICVCVCAYK